MKLAMVTLLIAGAAHAESKVPQEITDLAKILTGTWKCSGTMQLPDATQPTPLTATVRTKVDLDGFWIHDTFEGKAGKTVIKSESFTTFDGKKWRRVVVDNRGTQVLGTSDGPKDGRMDFNLDVIGGAVPASQSRYHLDATDPKALKFDGELSTDKGKTWNKVYEVTCKR